MSFGVNVWNGSGALTLDMGDFTLQKLAVMVLPANPSGGIVRPAPRSDYILMDVAGYNPSTCFVTITPRSYSTGATFGRSVIPTYRDLGGTQIAIIPYANYRFPNGSGGWIESWVESTVESVIEVVRVI
ncbi:hypothetical protein BK652_09930 [Pseudomonas brassicacearum]|uniref:Uncharacterized protein n=1 Tax=Pseudomonas brassicacearum TaxID=930166 RepID=A0A423GDG0_9PSED|nr:hypothetical protein BK652_09930 [Pseudomonas brassicacearum]